MSLQIFANPWPYAGRDNTQNLIAVSGSIQLYGSYPSGGEPVDWTKIVSAFGYNELSPLGLGVAAANGSAQVTTLSASAGTITATAANNFVVGQQVTFVGCTSTLGLLLNGQTVTVVTASSSQFTFTNAATGTGTGETGIVYSGRQYGVVGYGSNPLTASVTAVSASGGVVTVTAANNFVPGAQVTFSGFASGTLGPKLITASPLTVASATSSAFKITSGLTGTTGTGTAIGSNPAQPIFVKFSDGSDTGYTFNYSPATASLQVQVSSSTAGNPAADISATTYPAALLACCLKYRAYFVKQ